MTRRFSPHDIAVSAVVAALYAVVTILSIQISFGAMQVRVAEALTLLPVLTPAAIPGLFLGCLISNLVGGASALDMIFGPLATLLAAFLTRKLRAKPVLAAIPPVLVNAFVVGAVLHFAYALPFWATCLSVGAGQCVACFALGLPLLWGLRKLPTRL